jgi:diguanylate cyclase (GGDEF)-like protein
MLPWPGTKILHHNGEECDERLVDKSQVFMSLNPINILVPAAIFLCGVGLLATDRAGLRTSSWGHALCLLGIGYSMMAVQTQGICVVKQVAEDMVIMAGVIFGGRALRRRYGVSPKLHFELAVLLSVALMIVVSLMLFQSVKLETMFAQIGCTAILWEASMVSSRLAKSSADRLLTGTFLFLSLAMTGLCLLYAVAPEVAHQTGAWRESIWGSLVQYTGLLASIVLAFAVMIANSTDIIEKHRRRADTDALTNLLNRRGLETILASAQGRRFKETRTAVILADIDHFKTINDRFGHPFGDGVIARFASLLQAQAGAQALVARLGGEEFIVLLPEAELDHSIAVADQMRRALELQRWSQKVGKEAFTASFGVTLTHQDEPFPSTIDRADRLLYVAKRNGRNCTVGSDRDTKEWVLVSAFAEAKQHDLAVPSTPSLLVQQL